MHTNVRVKRYVHTVISMKNTPRRPAVLTEDGEAKTSTIARGDLRAIGTTQDITVTLATGCKLVSALRMHETKRISGAFILDPSAACVNQSKSDIGLASAKA